MKILYDRVLQLCVANNIDLRELEIRSGLSRYAIDKWEFGSAFIESIIKVANYFDVSIDYLSGKTDNPKSHKTQDVLAIENQQFAESLIQLQLSMEKVVGYIKTYMPYAFTPDEKDSVSLIAESKKLMEPPTNDII